MLMGFCLVVALAIQPTLGAVPGAIPRMLVVGVGVVAVVGIGIAAGARTNVIGLLAVLSGT